MWVKAIRSKSKKDLLCSAESTVPNAPLPKDSKKSKKNIFSKVFRVTRVLNAFKTKKHTEIPSSSSSDATAAAAAAAAADNHIHSKNKCKAEAALTKTAAKKALHLQLTPSKKLSPNFNLNQFSKVTINPKQSLIVLWG